jgi:hypothetical protein
MALIDYGLRILALSAFISIVTAALLFIVAVRFLLVRPDQARGGAHDSYAEAPDDASRIIEPQGSVRELRDAENALQSMQTQLTGAAAARTPRPAGGGRGQDQPRPAQHPVGHDAHGRPAGGSADPAVQRATPKILAIADPRGEPDRIHARLRSRRGAVPKLERVRLADIAEDVVENERLTSDQATG